MSETAHAQYAFGAINRDLVAAAMPPANCCGEIPGHGPAYACSNYGAPWHNYIKCGDCWDAFCRHCDARTQATP